MPLLNLSKERIDGEEVSIIFDLFWDFLSHTYQQDPGDRSGNVV